ncbi:hypothetical protein CCS01_15290 [Rhodopila globiformis]|uniref:Uncharacterized protein n=1 Tax=Rhodopila globiformis TaxID=1071 RepID=A0A2S6NED2_RHOGL|nr:hypothetical protein CCS01_15290 [Rhodopila globiformis]
MEAPTAATNAVGQASASAQNVERTQAEAADAPPEALRQLARMLGRQAARQRFRGYTIMRVPLVLLFVVALLIGLLLLLNHASGRF